MTNNNLSFVTIAGMDAVPFLQRTLSADTTPLYDEKAVWANLLNSAGRILFTFLIFPVGQGLWLQIRKQDAENLKLALQKLVLAENIHIACHHEMTTTFLMPHKEHHGQLLPHNKGSVQRIDRALHVHDPRMSELGSRVITVYGEDIPSSILAHHQILSANHYQFLTYKYSIIEQPYFKNFRPFLPVELGHQHYKAIDFNKGCFIGQEVNARVHLKSKLRKYIHGGYSAKNPFLDISYPHEILSVDSQAKIRIMSGVRHTTGEWAGLVLVEGESSPSSIEINGSSILLTPRLM